MKWRLPVQVFILFAKDLRVELRTREVLYTAGLFTLVLLTVFVFADLSHREVAALTGPGLLWIALAFVGVLVFGRTFQRERESRAIEALLLVPGVMDALFLSKLLINLALLILLQLLLVPGLLLLFGLSPGDALVPLILVLLAGTLGFCTLGTVLSAALASVHLREVLLPLVLYPLCIPLIVAGVKATSILIRPEEVMGDWTEWLGMMIAFDALFLVLGRWLFGEALDRADS